MAMFVFQELAPKIFYFTYCMQETDKYISYIEENDIDENSNKKIISKWEKLNSNSKNLDYGFQKTINANLLDGDLNPSNKELYLVNSIKHTINFAFSEYKKFNNINEQFRLYEDLTLRKYNEKHLHHTMGENKYFAMMFINDNYEGGTISIENTKVFLKPEKGSIIILPSDITLTSSPTFNGLRYVATGSWY
jgi:hypothetical protein